MSLAMLTLGAALAAEVSAGIAVDMGQQALLDQGLEGAAMGAVRLSHGQTSVDLHLGATATTTIAYTLYGSDGYTRAGLVSGLLGRWSPPGDGPLRVGALLGARVQHIPWSDWGRGERTDLTVQGCGGLGVEARGERVSLTVDAWVPILSWTRYRYIDEYLELETLDNHETTLGSPWVGARATVLWRLGP